MRLVDLVNQAQRKASEASTVIRHPFAVAYQHGRRQFQKWFENASIPGFRGSQQRVDESSDRPYGPDASEFPEASAQPPPPSLPRSVLPPPPSRPLSSSPRLQTVDFFDDFFTSDVAILAPLKRVFRPLLLQGETLQGGWWGRYLVRGCLEDEGWVRLYEGLQENNQEAVWIYEYLLTEATFSLKEAEQRQHAFRQLINQNLQLGGGADFRLIKIKDVILDVETKRRCFLIIQPISEAETLSDYVENREPMHPSQVRQVLYQVLQSLQYLHSTYWVRWLKEQSERGLVHGNLSLDSLWIRWDPATLGLRERHFFVYLSRFALWEHLCCPEPLKQVADHPQALGTVSQDLADLGELSFYLLKGGTVNPATKQLWDPKQEQDWPQNPEAQALKPFIWKMMGLGDRLFPSADQALSQLRDLPPTTQAEPEPSHLSESQNAETTPPFSISPMLLLGLGLLAFLSLFTLLQLRSRDQPLLAERCEGVCRIDQVPSPDNDTLRYGVEAGSSWVSTFYHFLEDPLEAIAPPSHESSPLQHLLRQRSGLNFQRLSQGNLSVAELLNQVSTGQIDAALLQTSVEDLPANLKVQPVAYDAIVPFVVFSDANQPQSLPRRLQGRIALADLGEVFTGEPSRLGQEVQLYFPDDAVTVGLFKAQLQAAGLLSSEAASGKFERLYQKDQEKATLKTREGHRGNLYERMLVDFENQTEGSEVVGIGFDRLSRVFGQCSVYPLAVQAGGRTHQVIIQANGDPITPETDLCGDKGSYWVDSHAFTRDGYPLGYALSVVYRACEQNEDMCDSGAAFAAMLQTDEGQYLLSEVGLVPQQTINHLRRILWSNQP